jgi:hypothetical protein
MQPLHSAIKPPPSSQGSTRSPQAHPLLTAFPLAVMTIGTLLVVFALIMALNADRDAAGRPHTTTHAAASVAAPQVATRGS